jgi:hypothetical protein
MHDALVRSVTDLKTGRSTHDGCPITALHVANARKIAKPGERYILGEADTATTRRSTWRWLTFWRTRPVRMRSPMVGANKPEASST